MKKTFLIFLLFICSLHLSSQQNNSSFQNDSLARVKAEKKKNYSEPRKASILSACLPGLGQAYNKKAWKIPIIYAGLGGFTYMFILNNDQYNYYRRNLISEADGDPATINTTSYDQYQLQTLKITYRKRRDIGAVGVIVIYILNIIDANVDAHLKTFDVGDDLSLRVEPWQSTYYGTGGIKTAAGLSFKLTIK